MCCMASTSGTTLCCLISMCRMVWLRSSCLVGIALSGYQRSPASRVWILRHGYTRRMDRKQLRCAAAVMAVALLAAPFSFGWGNAGHKMVNRLGAEGLPADVPAFL